MIGRGRNEDVVVAQNEIMLTNNLEERTQHS